MPKKLNFLGGQQNYDPKTGEYEPDLTNKQGEPVKGFSSFKKSDAETSKSSFDTYNDKRMGKETENKFNDLIDKDYKPTDAGKIIQYKPYVRKADGSWGREEGNTRRAKTLNNGLAMETKAYDKEHVYHEQIGKYKLVDLETGTMVGWAKDYDDAMEKSNNEEFIAAIKRAKEVHKKMRKED